MIFKCPSVIVLMLLASACASGPMAWRSEGPIRRPEFHGSQTVAESPNEIEREIQRDRSQDYYPNYVYVKFIPRTVAYSAAQLGLSVKEEGFKKRWSAEETEKELQAKLKINQNEIASSTCFLVEVTSNDAAANESEAWYATLKGDDGTSLDLKFATFTGFTETTTHAYQSYDTINIYDSKVYKLFSTACAPKYFDLAKEFAVVVEPRYNVKLKPMNLRWGNPVRK